MDADKTSVVLPPNPSTSSIIRSTPGTQDQTPVITRIVVKDVTLDLKHAITAIRSQRIPVGMYIAVSTNDFEYKTVNKPITPSGDIQWENEIVLPPDPSSHVFIRVYASFELEPMLGVGELLRVVQITAGEILDKSDKSLTFLSSPEETNNIPLFPSLLLVADYRQGSHCHDQIWPRPNDATTLTKMTDAGHKSLFRYRDHRQEEDLLNGVSKFENALESCPIDHPQRAVAIFNLAAAKFISSHINGRYAELDSAVNLCREALDQRRPNDLDRIHNLFYLAIALLRRSDDQHLIPDREEAKDILLLIQAELSPAHSLHHQAASLVIETFDLLGDVDTTETGKAAEEPDPDSHREDLLGLLNEALNRCIDGSGVERLDEVILGYRNAMTCHIGGLLYPSFMGNLGVAQKLRFDRDGKEDDLDSAISYSKESVSLSPDRVMTVNNLAALLLFRFNRRGDKQDLDNAIMYYRNALELEPIDVLTFKNLAGVLSRRYELQGGQKDLDESISRGFYVLMALFSPHSRDPTFGIQHADRLRERYLLRKNQNDLELCIQISRSAVAHLPGNHESLSAGLFVLSRALYIRYKDCGGDNHNLDFAVSCGQRALDLMPPHDDNRPAALRCLTEAYSTRFEHSSNVDDLTKEISLLQEHLLSCPDDVTRACALARAQINRYLHHGGKQDLDDAILRLRNYLERSLSDGEKEEVTANLAPALARRHDCLDGNLQTIDEAIQLYRRVLATKSPGDINYDGCLNNLAAALNSRFKRTHDNETLDEIIRLYQEVLASNLLTGPRRAKPLTNLGNVIERRNTEADIDKAISLHKEALESQPNGDPFRPVVMSNIANAYLKRFYLQRNLRDLDQADLYAKGALEMYSKDAVERPSVLLSLAEIACTYIEHAQDNTMRSDLSPSDSGHMAPNVQEHLEVAIRFLQEAEDLRSSGPIWGLRTSLKLVEFAEKYNHGIALSVYARCLELLDTHLSTTASISSRHEFMQIIPRTLATDAASCALRLGDTCRAVELLEQGRSIIWTQMSRYRTPVDELLLQNEHSSQLAARFQNLSSLLNNPQIEGGPSVFPEEKARNYKRIVEDWSNVVEEIRKLDHFNRFLLPPLFSDLQEAACDGPVIILVASKYTCDAMIILHSQPPLHIRSPTDIFRLVDLAKSLREAVYRTRYTPDAGRRLRELLQQLWDSVVSPVVPELEKVAKKRSRIWWCPTSVFSLLPIHAAGEFFRSQGRHLSQLYISSYTPSLSALIKARARKNMATTKHFVAIGQAQPPGHSLPLMSVEPELGLVESLVPKTGMNFSKITSAESVKDGTLDAIRENEWIHLACHGVQVVREPYNSCFLMRDEPLTLFDISRTDLRTHEFAFLSACETAVGTLNVPDEVINLAAGLQFAGVKSVVGTMWEVEDATVRLLIEAFYTNMFRDGKADCTKAAESLHKALRSPAVKRMTLAQQIVFIHIGI